MAITRDHVRLYHQIRTAHLERAAQLPPATIVYGDKRYDFEDSLAAGLDLVHARGWRAAWFLFRHPVSVLEVNEPLMLHGVRSTALALLGLALRERAGRARTHVVSYAIENLDPRLTPAPASAKHRLARRLDSVLAGRIWRRLDRVAYGTRAAQQTYAAAFPGLAAPESRVVPALPAPAPDADPGAKQASEVLFVGAFTQRKGFALLMRAWPLVSAEQPTARLTLVGKGALQPLAEQAAAEEPSVRLLVDPPRAQIHQLLASSQVLVLPCQPTPTWREQVGLPIVEGLSYGCTVVTTTETGLASWLAAAGHHVTSADATAEELAAAILAAVRHPLQAGDVLASLPDVDGRLAADDWLFRRTDLPLGDDRTETSHV